MIHSFWSNYALQEYKIPRLLTPSSLFVKQKWSEFLVLNEHWNQTSPPLFQAYSRTGYSMHGLHYTPVTVSSESEAIPNSTSNLGFWNPALCQALEQKSPKEAVWQPPSSPQPSLTGSAPRLRAARQLLTTGLDSTSPPLPSWALAGLLHNKCSQIWDSLPKKW